MVEKLILFGCLLSNLASSFDISSFDARRQHKTNGLMHCQPSRYFGSHSCFDVAAIRQCATCLSAISDHDSVEDVAVGPKEVVDPLISLLIAQFLLFIGVGAVIPSIPLYGKELGFSSAANGLVISIPAVAMLILSKVGGNYADQGRKPAMIFGMALIALSDLGTALAASLPMLIVARLGLGAGRCISESGERGMLADLANQMPQNRGRALAAQQACAAVGIAIGAPLGGIVVEEYGPRAAFLCVTVAATIAMIIYCFLPETMNFSEKLKDEIGASKVSDSFSTADKADWGRLLSQNQWRGIAICQSGASFGFGAKIAAIPLLAASHLPGGAAAAGSLISAVGLSGLIGAPVGGLLTDRAGAKVAVIWSGLLSAFGLIFIPLALGPNFHQWGSVNIGKLALDANAQAFVGSVIVWGIGASAQTPALVALAQQNAPKGSEATALALPKAFGDGTYIVVPFILGLVTDTFSDLPGSECAAAGAASLLGVMAVGFWCEDR